MLTKDVLDEIIKRRYDEGKTLSIERIYGEKYSKWQIRDAAREFYGGWANARNEVTGVSKYVHKPKMNKQEVIAELRRLQDQGHSMKSGDFEQWFYRRIVDVFGGYTQAKKELGVTQKRKSGSGRKAPEVSEMISELKKVYPEIKTKGDYHSKARRVYDYSRRRYGDAYKIFEIAGLEVPGSKKRKRTAVYWTDERISEELRGAVNKCASTSSGELDRRGYRRIVDAVKRRYGTWNAGLVALGYEVAYKYRDPNESMTKEEVKERVLSALKSGVRPSRTDLEVNITGLKTAIDKHFGGISNLKEYCGFCAISDRPREDVKKGYIPDLSTAEGIRREIIRLWYTGTPLNYSFIRVNRRHLLEAANEIIGSWREAVISSGIDYDTVSKTTNILSKCGSEFEDVFAEILTELGETYIREAEGVEDTIPGFRLRPDFILPDWHWIDCKLSEWTDVREMLIKYHKEKPNGITIVYLRGTNQSRVRGNKWRYNHVSVYQYTKLLPESKRKYYESRLRDIENKANKDAVAI